MRKLLPYLLMMPYIVVSIGILLYALYRMLQEEPLITIGLIAIIILMLVGIGMLII